MLEITFVNHTKIDMGKWQNQAILLIKTLLEQLDIDLLVTMSINFIDKTEALTMNQEFRHEEYVPDVISFPSGMEFDLAEQLGTYELGDLFICFEVAKQKAEHYHHELETEMGFLFVHGALHLLGFDHEQDDEREAMFSLQDKVLKANGYDYLVIFDDLDYIGE